MPSHAYFYSSRAVPTWGQLIPDTPERANVRRRIADALLESMPGMEELPPFEEGDAWIRMHVPGLEVAVMTEFVHLRIGWRSVAEHRELCLTEKLHQMARALDEAVGFDFFDHGCQGLGMRGDIDEVPYAVAGTTNDLHDLFRVPAESL